MRKITRQYGWNDIVLPPATRVEFYKAAAEISALRRQSRFSGLAWLFSGPPGTGKTMAAHVIAADLDLDLYRVDLSKVLSKYIAETEKNLERVFNQAENIEGVLFFDNADALLGKRSDADDESNGKALARLLEHIKRFPGLCILASSSIPGDSALIKRFNRHFNFSFLDEDQRFSIWKQHFPQGTRSQWRHLSRRYELSGGGIKRLANRAVKISRAEGCPMKYEHLEMAGDRTAKRTKP